MKPEPFVLDSSALLTLMDDEAGADRVQEVLESQRVLIPWTALMEVYYITHQELGEAKADLRYAALRQLAVEFLDEVPEPVLLTAARFKASHRLSFADCLIAAFALRHGATLVHKDPEFEAVADQVKLEALPYKNRPGGT